MNKRAIIVGANGQDGKLLTEFLEQKNYQLFKISRQSFNILDVKAIFKLMADFMPQELYFLAAFNYSSEIFHTDQAKLLKESFETSVLSLGYFYQAVVQNKLDCSFFNAASSLIFRPNETQLICEESKRLPMSIYANAKLSAINLGKYYIQEFGLKIYNGILFNHESKYRSERYLSKKIVRAVFEIKSGKRSTLNLKSLTSKVDWGASEDYIRGMHLLLNTHPSSGDYIFATGEAHTVEEFVDIAFSYVGLDYRDFVNTEATQLYRKSSTRIGNAQKLQSSTLWNREISFEQMVTNMIDSEFNNA